MSEIPRDPKSVEPDLVPDEEPEPVPVAEEYSPRRFLALQSRLGGFLGPLLTTVIAFIMGGLVVLLTGKNPLSVYKAIFNGTGLNWFFHFGSYHIHIPFTSTKVFFWWNTGSVAGLGEVTGSFQCRGHRDSPWRRRCSLTTPFMRHEEEELLLVSVQFPGNINWAANVVSRR